jgi:hypothetical protein
MPQFTRAPCFLAVLAAAALILTWPVAVSAGTAPVRILWIQTPETQNLYRSFSRIVADFSSNLEVLELRSGEISELYLKLQSRLEGGDGGLIFGLTLPQVQFLANNGVIQPIPSRDIKSLFSSSLYITASAKQRRAPGSLDSPWGDGIIAAPINVTLPVLCFDNRNKRIAGMVGQTNPSIEDVAGDTSIGRLLIPDPRVDTAGRAVLLSAFQESLGFHDGWKVVDMLDKKVDSYSTNHISSCLEAASGDADFAFATFDDVEMLRRRAPSLSTSALRGGTPVATIFAAVLRGFLGENVTALYRSLTGEMLERQIQVLRDSFRVEKVDLSPKLFYESGGTLSYKSSGQLGDEWAARYDYKSLSNLPRK